MASPLNSEQLKELEEILTAEMTRIMRNAKHMITDRVEEAEDLPADTIDVSTDESMAATLNRLRDREKFLLKKIEKSLAKIKHEEYGECEECGEPIGFARLKARPVATLCIDCKEDQERHEGKVADRRQREEDDHFSFIS